MFPRISSTLQATRYDMKYNCYCSIFDIKYSLYSAVCTQRVLLYIIQSICTLLCILSAAAACVYIQQQRVSNLCDQKYFSVFIHFVIFCNFSKKSTNNKVKIVAFYTRAETAGRSSLQHRERVFICTS